jgi:hypothetical protein
MSTPGRHAESQTSIAKALAFYLPQYHPIPENDEWWGKGFTEWANVAKAQPLYPGHYQPHLPGELGYYDLRVPEVREAQAELARDHGISGFVYYHYWFHGRRLLNRPFDEVLASGSPDFPFALCWANEEWTRNWDGQSGRVLIRQEYSDADDLAHFRWLSTAFADSRYITIDGKPLMLVYRPGVLPDPKRMTDAWRAEAQRMGFPDLYLCWVEGWGRPPEGPKALGFDATVGFMPWSGERLFTPIESLRPHRILDYVSAYESRLDEPPPAWKHFPSVMVGWDNTARYSRSATIFEGATPEQYGRWLERTVESVAHVPEEENYLFILAWNEWAEGNHLEPDLRYGRAFLEVTRSVLIGSVHAGSGAHLPLRGSPIDSADDSEAKLPTQVPDAIAHDAVIANAAGLVAKFGNDPDRLIVNLCTGSDVERDALLSDDIVSKALENHPESARRIKVATIDAVQCAVTDFAALEHTLDELGDVSAFLLLDVIDKLPQPQQLLADLSAWSIAHGNAVLFASVPNVGHFDLGLRLLFGEWTPSNTALLGSEPRHFFTETTLTQLFERSGWKLMAHEDVRSVRSESYDPELHDNLPEEMIGALRVLSETYNPQWAVEHFVWALSPVDIDRSLQSAHDTVASAGGIQRTFTDEQRASVEGYLASVGLIASETNRRAVGLRRMPRPRWQRALLRSVNAHPRTASAYKEVRRRIG